ncbi:MAG: VCBS repeat-containing protein [Gemmatimonadaceae bacterium]
MPGPYPRPFVRHAVVRQFLSAGLCLFASCTRSAAPASAAGYDPSAAAPVVEGKLFTRLPATYTGVRFSNMLRESRDTNVFTYRNFYNGGGVAIGDLTGDGLPEIVLTSNQGGTRLYLNEGKFRFRDITAQSGLNEHAVWTTGVTMADVDGDGRLDLYICHAGQTEPARRANALWINQGLGKDSLPHFAEKGEAFGVADRGYTTHAAFLDYDRDGDLDLFIINNSPRPASSFGPRNTRRVRDEFGGHKLFRNDNGHFVDVSEKAGIFGSEIGFGLGLGVGDVNRDGWPDIYVSNDFFEQDYLYVNKHDGSFAESLKSEVAVSSYFSMGMDIGDLNNDGWPDVFTTDMLPEDEYRLRTMSSFEGWDVYQAKIRDDYGYQLMRNMLQRNNGDGTFTDVGQMAGVSRTDWSWSALIADLDLDGRNDIYVTNGLVHDVTSQDYIAFLANNTTMEGATAGGRVDYMKLINAMTSTPLPDYAFHNLGNLSFRNESAAWGLDAPSFSSGAAYGDLDGDGAPDLVVNNTNAEAFVYRNNSRALHPTNHYLQLRLEGKGANREAIGARVTLSAGADTITQELFPARGFQSSVDYVLGFGVGTHDTVANVRVDWPDGTRTDMAHVAANQRLTISQDQATPMPSVASRAVSPMFAEVTGAGSLPFAHHENDFVDFDRERLIPKLVSTEGPMMAVGDVNGDRLDDVYIGGAKEQAGALLIQQPNGTFVKHNGELFELDAISEDLGAAFFDADGDGDLDLYVVSGGNEFSDLSPALADRLYLNDGHGSFSKSVGRLPDETFSGSRVVAADYDGDGDIDLFVGGRLVPWRYGENPTSLLLQNNGHGQFTNVTAQLAPELAQVGMVTDAVWQDLDGDRRPELVVVGEWMPVTIFHNAGSGRLTKANTPGLEKSNGWWNRIAVGDVDGDGRVDFVVGNLGLNTRLRATPTEPATMLVKDFDGNGYVKQIVACYWQGKQYPLVLRDDLIRALPPLKARFLNYQDYGRATLDDIFPAKDRAGAIEKTVYTFASAVVHNDGHGAFTLVPLPDEAQRAPIYGILPRDVNGDGRLDLLLAGNFDGFKPEIGRASESRGLLLLGDGTGKFQVATSAESGFVVPGQARDIQRLRTHGEDLIAVTRNNDRPLVFRPTTRRIALSATAHEAR